MNCMIYSFIQLWRWSGMNRLPMPAPFLGNTLKKFLVTKWVGLCPTMSSWCPPTKPKTGWYLFDQIWRFGDQNCWFYSNPESTVWMVSVFFRMATPILTTRINKMGSRINKVGPRIDKGGPRINKVGKPETTNRVARPICSMVQTPKMNVNLINQWELS